MIEEAIPVMQSADVFILVGTSLAVYPAAGLVDYVDDDVVKYVVDKKVPDVTRYCNVVKIERPATVGLEQVRLLLGAPSKRG